MASRSKNITVVSKASFRAGNYSPLDEFDATVSVTEADDALAATATALVSGALNATEADDLLSAAGAAPVTATLAATEANDILAASAGPSITGALSVVEADETLSAAAGDQVSGTLAATEADDTLSAAAHGDVSGTVVAAEADDALVAVGDVEPINAALATAEVDDSLHARGNNGVVTLGYSSPLVLAFGANSVAPARLGYRGPLPLATGAGSQPSQVITEGGGTPPQVYRPRRKAGIALGKLFIIECSLIPGAASGDAFAAGAEFFVQNATTKGAILTVDKSIISGTAAGERNWSDEEIMILAEAA